MAAQVPDQALNGDDATEIGNVHDYLASLRSQVEARLTDATRRNPFLYFRSLKTRFETPALESEFITTLLDGNLVRRALFETSGAAAVSDQEGVPASDDPSTIPTALPPGRRATRAPRAIDPLMSRLRAIQQRAKELEEERGLQTLYVALGMVSWPSDDGGTKPRGPIVLLPVKIVEDPHVRGDLALRRADDAEYVVNRS